MRTAPTMVVAESATSSVVQCALATVAEITRKLRPTRKIVDKWVRPECLPERALMAPKSSTPAWFATYLRDRWAEGQRNVRRLLQEVREQGFTGHLVAGIRWLASWVG